MADQYHRNVLFSTKKSSRFRKLFKCGIIYPPLDTRETMLLFIIDFVKRHKSGGERGTRSPVRRSSDRSVYQAVSDPIGFTLQPHFQFNISISLLIFFVIFTTNALAIYDPLSVPNNRIGVHILETAEVEKAASLVNHSGDWGYVTIPIRANDRDLVRWTKFMGDSTKFHIIPILRIASFPVEDHWMAPNEYDLIDFANFLDNLPWPTKNHYVVIYNEPNHKNEWGGFVYPEEYAHVLDRAIDIFHKTNQDFFVISAGFDSSAPNSKDSLNEYVYLQIMNETVPGIFSKIDGFSSHSYGNPGFSSPPNIYSPVSVANYRFEEGVLTSLGAPKPKIFITEAGWINAAQIYYRQAFETVWTDDNIVAITPFVLSAQAGPFKDFSLLDTPGADVIKNFPKMAGKPQLRQESIEKNANINPKWTGNLPPTSSFNLIDSLRAVFFRIFPLQK